MGFKKEVTIVKMIESSVKKEHKDARQLAKEQAKAEEERKRQREEGARERMAVPHQALVEVAAELADSGYRVSKIQFHCDFGSSFSMEVKSRRILPGKKVLPARFSVFLDADLDNYPKTDLFIKMTHQDPELFMAREYVYVQKQVDGLELWQIKQLFWNAIKTWLLHSRGEYFRPFTREDMTYREKIKLTRNR